MTYTHRRAVIFAKTYPELSTKHTETVCTGALDAQTGAPIRLYPVPLRYLEDGADYKLWEEVDVPVRKSDSDPRPESFKINAQELRRISRIGTDEGWRDRRAIVNRDASWHFATLAALKEENVRSERSIGMVRPGVIDDVHLVEKTASDREAYRTKCDELRTMKEADLFDPTYKELEYLPYQVVLRWRCAARCETCKTRPHKMQVLDWGLLELGRRSGWDKAKARLEEISDARHYDFQLFLGNFRLHPRNFGIIGLWYPKIQQQTSLF